MTAITYGCVARYVITHGEDDESQQKLVFSIEKEPTGYVMVLRKFGGGKKCSMLVIPPQRWVNLVLQMQSVNDAINKVRKEGDGGVQVKELVAISGNLHVSIETPYWVADLRQYYMDKEGVLKPGRNGVPLKFHEWSKLCYQCVEMVKVHAPEVAELQPCATRVDNNNQEGVMECAECTPPTA